MKKGICLFFGFLFCFMSIIGCSDNSNHGSGRAYAAPPVMPAAKPPAAFSNDGEFLGYVVGHGSSGPHHIEIYNDDINYRFVVSNGTGLIAITNLPSTHYSTDSECKDLYVTINRFRDFIQGANDEYGSSSWPYESQMVTSDFTQPTPGSTIKYQKVWGNEPITKNETCVVNQYFTGNPGDPGYPLPPPPNWCDAPNYVNPDNATQCLGICSKQDYERDENGDILYKWRCRSLPDNFSSSYTYHKVIPATIPLPFKVPVEVPIDIRVIY